MADIIKEVLKDIPDEAKISDACFEGANIVVYTKNREFFLNNEGVIKEIVDKIKKRVELRPDPSMTMDVEEAEKLIKKLMPEDAGVDKITFDPQRSQVIVEAEKPGVAIGKNGEILRDIKKETLWVPLVRRTPAIRSKIIEKIRAVLYENNDYRRKFLDKCGKRIYNGWIRDKRKEWIRVSFLGGARQVGRSCVLLQTPESRVLLDCGIDVAADENNMFPFLDAPEFKVDELDAVVLSHAHLDHCALIPYLYKFGYIGPVYCTAPVRDVAALLCLDYINIAEQEGKKVIYSSADIKEMVKHTICLDYEEVTDITPDVRLTLYNAGHTLGSSMVHLHIGNGLHNLLYTGDMNYELSNLLNMAATKFPRLETVIIEGTYGGKDDIPATRQESEETLHKIVNDTLTRGGKILMPVLGVGRSQEVALIIEKSMREGKIPKVPVYIQGMVWDVTAIHTAYPDFFNNIVKKMIFHKDQNPFLSDAFKQVGSQKEQTEIIEKEGPCIIMATSGMMVGGASVQYFKELAENPKNSLILTCYQGPGSLGRKLESGEKEIYLEGCGDKPIKVNMDIFLIKGFSGHSNRQQLMDFVANLEPRPKKIIINHAENSKCLDLASSFHKAYSVETNAPKNLEVIRVK